MKVEGYVTWIFDLICPYCDDEKTGSVRVHLFEDDEIRKALMCSRCGTMMYELRFTCNNVGYHCSIWTEPYVRFNFNLISSIKERIN